jgi:hypothetical protein
MAIDLDSIPLGQRVLHSNALATLTKDCLMARGLDQKCLIIVPLARISQVKTVKTEHAPLIVFASGSFLVAAAAHFSKEGGGAEIPSALIGIALVVMYAATRRASVIFEIGSETIRTAFGTLTEAAELILAIHSASFTDTLGEEVAVLTREHFDHAIHPSEDDERVLQTPACQVS